MYQCVLRAYVCTLYCCHGDDVCLLHARQLQTGKEALQVSGPPCPVQLRNQALVNALYSFHKAVTQVYFRSAAESERVSIVVAMLFPEAAAIEMVQQ